MLVNLVLKPVFDIISCMSEGQPLNPFRFRRITQDARPDTKQFRDDTSRMDEILDCLSQGILREDSVSTSAFTSLYFPEADRPISPDDFLLLSEIVRLRADLSYEATQRAALLRNAHRHRVKAHSDSSARQKPRG